MDNQPPPVQPPLQPLEPASAPAAPPQVPLPELPVENSLPPATRQPLFPMIMIIVVVVGGSLAGLGGGLALKSYLHKKDYQASVQDFITAMQKNDKAKADSLESPAAKVFLKKSVGTTSFYDACRQQGVLCTASFKASYLAKGVKTYKNYTAQDGTKGKAVVYTVKESLNGAQAGGQGCSSKSTNTLSFDVVPAGNTWLIDNIDTDINFSANLCNGTGGSSTTGN